MPTSDDVEDETMEDSGDDDHGVVDSGKLLDRLFDEGLLPKYAFPTDVATFSVFEEGTDPWNPKRRYSPQQSLNAALSQYAPGHEVWVDGQRYLSLGLYSEREEERFDAYRDKRLYYQCRVCNYADLKELEGGLSRADARLPRLQRPRDARTRAALGRPTGFSHPPASPRCRPISMQVRALRPTRATLDSLQFPDAARIGGETWPIGTGWEGWGDTKTLVVTNRGSLTRSTMPSTIAALRTHRTGRLRPGDASTPLGSDAQPAAAQPAEGTGRMCTGTFTKIVLGNEFDTDVVGLPPGAPANLVARSRPRRHDDRGAICGRGAAPCGLQLEDLEPNDIDGDFRFAPGTVDHQFIDLYLYDQAAGGAGFVKAAARDPHRLVDAALDLLDRCDCDDSCYQCLRSYKNRYDHALFDRRIGADLLRACFKGAPLTIEPGARGLCARPARRRSEGKRRAGEYGLDGGLVDKDGKIICLAHPFVENRALFSIGLASSPRVRTQSRSIFCSSCARCRLPRTSRSRCPMSISTPVSSLTLMACLNSRPRQVYSATSNPA